MLTGGHLLLFLYFLNMIKLFYDIYTYILQMFYVFIVFFLIKLFQTNQVAWAPFHHFLTKHIVLLNILLNIPNSM